MSALDETFGAADEELADAEEVHVHSIALERMQHHLRTRMCSREQRLSHADASALGVDFARHRRGLIEWMCDGTDRLALHRSTFHTASARPRMRACADVVSDGRVPVAPCLTPRLPAHGAARFALALQATCSIERSHRQPLREKAG